MHDGWEYVAATYGIVTATLVAWFWIILAKLRRQRSNPRPPEATSVDASHGAERAR